MPKVGKMKFPYTKRGMEEASAYAQNSGKRMEVESYQYGGRVSGMRPRLGGGMRPRLGGGMRPRGRGMNPGILRALMNRLKGRR